MTTRSDPMMAFGLENILNAQNVNSKVSLRQGFGREIATELTEQSQQNGGSTTQRNNDAFSLQLQAASKLLGLDLETPRSISQSYRGASTQRDDNNAPMRSAAAPMKSMRDINGNFAIPEIHVDNYAEPWVPPSSSAHCASPRAGANHWGSPAPSSRQFIDQAINYAPTNAMNSQTEDERQEDKKQKLLAEIDELMENLRDTDVDISRVATVTIDSSLREITSVHYSLIRKNLHSRCITFAEEGILFSSHVAGKLFDGRTSYFGFYPNLTGWYKNVQTKMIRMRYDTKQIAETIVDNLAAGPVARMALELIPSALMFSINKSEQHSESGVFDDAAMSNSVKLARNM